MSTVVVPTRSNVSVLDVSHYLDGRRLSKKRLILYLIGEKLKSLNRGGGFKRILGKLRNLWPGLRTAVYDEVRVATLEQWIESPLLDKKFLEKAIDLLAEFQNWSMKNRDDRCDWLSYLEKAEIDLKRYFRWVDEQYELVTRKKRKGFKDITLKRFSDCLVTADWKYSNDESAIFNTYLLDTKAGLEPEIYLGPFKNSHLAVRMNGESLRPQKADISTIEACGVTTINPDILLAMRYVPLQLGKLMKSLLFNSHR